MNLVSKLLRASDIDNCTSTSELCQLCEIAAIEIVQLNEQLKNQNSEKRKTEWKTLSKPTKVT